MNARGPVVSITPGRVEGLTMWMSRSPVFILILALGLVGRTALADSPTVTAVLTSSEAAVGQMVQMEIKVTGANNIEAPENIPVDGLEIHQTGTSRQFEMRNFTTS